MRHHETAGVPEASDILTEATVLQQTMWPEVPCSTGALLHGWTTAAELFSSPSALQEFLDYEASFDPGVDIKSRAAFLMSDYCYIFFMATVPLLVSRGIVPDMSPDAFSLQFYTHHGEHDGEPMTVRRARVRLLSPQIFADRDDGPHSTVTDHAGLCEHFRMGVEQHFRRCEHVIEQADFTKVAFLRQMKSEKLVVDCRGDKIQELYLVAHLDWCAWVRDLRTREAHFIQLRFELDSRRLRALVGEPADAPAGNRKTFDTFSGGLSCPHATASCKMAETAQLTLLGAGVLLTFGEVTRNPVWQERCHFPKGQYRARLF